LSPGAVEIRRPKASLSFFDAFFFFVAEVGVGGNETTEHPDTPLRTTAVALDTALQVADDFAVAEQELDTTLDSTALPAGFSLLLPLASPNFINKRMMVMRSFHNLQASGNWTMRKTYTVLATCFRIGVFLHTT
jgi:hypothetical protein